MIKSVTGDILKSKAEAIAHGIAPNDDFKQGLALALRTMWPALYKDFRHYCHTSHPKAGTLWFWGGAGGVHIYNLLTQDPPPHAGGHPGRATYEHVNECLRQLRHELEKSPYRSIALPRVATGVGGLEWDKVEPLITKHLGDLKQTVILYTTYQKDVAADEGL